MKKYVFLFATFFMTACSNGQTLTEFEEKLIDFRYGFYLDFERMEDSLDFAPGSFQEVLQAPAVVERVKKFVQDNTKEIAQYQLNQLLRYSKTHVKIEKSDFTPDTTLNDFSEFKTYIGASYLEYLQIELLGFLEYIHQMHLSRRLTTSEFAKLSIKSTLARGRVQTIQQDAQHWKILIDKYEWLVEGYFDQGKNIFTEVRLYRRIR